MIQTSCKRAYEVQKKGDQIQFNNLFGIHKISDYVPSTCSLNESAASVHKTSYHIKPP